RKGKELYAISPTFPKGELIIKKVKPSKSTKVTLLGHPGELPYEYKGGNLVLQVPALTYDELPCHHAWSFKISEVK
ncbi:MAG: alpha-L-fucosidase C-terminal domain-containing protein, partial [Bacteroidota bacterium]